MQSIFKHCSHPSNVLQPLAKILTRSQFLKIAAHLPLQQMQRVQRLQSSIHMQCILRFIQSLQLQLGSHGWQCPLITRHSHTKLRHMQLDLSSHKSLMSKDSIQISVKFPSYVRNLR